MPVERREAGQCGEGVLLASRLREFAEGDDDPPALVGGKAHGENIMKTGDWSHRGRVHGNGKHPQSSNWCALPPWTSSWMKRKDGEEKGEQICSQRRLMLLPWKAGEPPWDRAPHA